MMSEESEAIARLRAYGVRPEALLDYFNSLPPGVPVCEKCNATRESVLDLCSGIALDCPLFKRVYAKLKTTGMT